MSTPNGWTTSRACFTFSAFSPPARKTGRDDCSTIFRLSFQLWVRPVPPSSFTFRLGLPLSSRRASALSAKDNAFSIESSPVTWITWTLFTFGTCFFKYPCAPFSGVSTIWMVLVWVRSWWSRIDFPVVSLVSRNVAIGGELRLQFQKWAHHQSALDRLAFSQQDQSPKRRSLWPWMPPLLMKCNRSLFVVS